MILATANAGAAGGYASMILSFVLMIAFLYFFMIRPQQKEQKKKNAMLSALEVGDTVLTTSGFYGTIKNCRIPMQRAAISVVEKPEDSIKQVEDKKEKKK